MDLNKFTHAYFVGIGGIGMSALARYLKLQGKKVAGYDKNLSRLTHQLESEDIAVSNDNQFKNIPAEFRDANTLVVYTPAIKMEHPILVGFKDLQADILKRSALLGELSKNFCCLAVGGTHGKTTTCGILSHLMKECGFKITALVGGVLTNYDSNFLHTGEDYLIVEADEFDRSFLQLNPDILGITSVDVDHLDIYENEVAFQEAFLNFSQLVEEKKRFINCSVHFSGQVVASQQSDFHARDIEVKDGKYEFTFVHQGKHYPGFKLSLPGRHNIDNALMAMAMAIEVGAKPEDLRDAINSFEGIRRRFNIVHHEDDLTVIDDYAHHPTEISAVYTAGREMFPGKRDMVIFQPHLFSRTDDFMDGFVASLSQFQQVRLLDIYPAREEPIEGVNAEALAKQINRLNTAEKAKVIQKDAILEEIRNTTAEVVILLGAGDIGDEIPKIISALKNG